MYLQLLGTALGSKSGSPYACLTVGYLGDKTFNISMKVMQVNYGIIKTLYRLWFYILAIKVKLWKL